MVELNAGQQFKLSSNVNVEELFADYNTDEGKASYDKAIEAAKDGYINENELVDLQATFSSAELDELLKDATVEDVPETEDGDKTEGGEKTGKKSENPEIKKLQGEIATWQAELEKAKGEIDTLTAKQNAAKKEYDDAVKEKDAKAKELEEKNQTLKEISEAIDRATENLEEDMNAKIRKAKNKAIMSYDPAEHGDNFSAYLDKQLEDIGVDPSIRSMITSLGIKAENITAEIKTAASILDGLWTKVETTGTAYTQAAQAVAECQDIITNNPNKIAANQAKIKELDPYGAIRDMIGCKEMELIEKLEIDMTETLSDGKSPRYIIAKGAEDGQYHVYDMADRCCGRNIHRSIVRRELDYSPESLDMIPMNNGYISLASEEGGIDSAYNQHKTSGTVYYMNACGCLEDFCTDYDTESPLTFDLNGDGIQTSDEQVEFDIDGDGVMDKIYDAADAVLVFDKDGDGISGEDGSELFGNNTDLDGDGKADGYKDGFEALAALARKEGLINGGDDMELDENDLKYLADTYGLKIKTGGYNSDASSLEDAGITKINLSNAAKSSQTNFDGKHNDIMRQDGATFEMKDENGNSVTREYADVWNVKLDADGNPIKESEIKNHKDIAKSMFSGVNLNINRTSTKQVEQDASLAESTTKDLNSKIKKSLDKYKN